MARSSPSKELTRLILVATLLVTLELHTAHADILATTVATTFDAALVVPLGVITAPGQVLTGTRAIAGSGVIDATAARVCTTTARPAPGVLPTDGDSLVQLSTAVDDMATRTELELILRLKPADTAQVLRLDTTISAAVVSPQSKAIAAIARATAPCGPDARIVTSVVIGDMTLTLVLRGPPSGDLSSRIKAAIDPTGTNFRITTQGAAITLSSTRRFVIGANLEPLAAYR